MFFCEHCKDSNDWPASVYKSLGKCEVCGTQNVLCNDIPSKYLPVRKKPNTTSEVSSNRSDRDNSITA